MVESMVFERPMKVTLSVQAQKVLAQTGYSPEEFIDWAIENNPISFGGHNVLIFLEHKYKEEH